MNTDNRAYKEELSLMSILWAHKDSKKRELFCLVNILRTLSLCFSQYAAGWLFVCKPGVEEENPPSSTEDAPACVQVSKLNLAIEIEFQVRNVN